MPMARELHLGLQFRLTRDFVNRMSTINNELCLSDVLIKYELEVDNYFHDD
jgi:hypothetical protein